MTRAEHGGRGRHRHGEPRPDVWLGRLWLLGAPATLTLLALTVQQNADHMPAAPVSAPDTEPAPRIQAPTDFPPEPRWENRREGNTR
ncbi:hypothetical protein AB0D83_17265 [Streptomyces decoyicus]|uniref:hypothetical protein n=1 Tax=Streptomyces decoyicus TaxID=249567 RepID=UPI0033E90B0E